MNSKFIVNLNDQLYYFKATLYNGTQLVELPQGFIESISIKEMLFEWAAEGTLLLKSDFEFFERGALNSNGRSQSLYTFRSDGRNKLNICFFPLKNSNIENIDESFAENWEINYDFVITSIEDIASSNNTKKYKQISFVDERLQLFSEINTLWSTSFLSRRILNDSNPTANYSPVVIENAKLNKCKIGSSIRDLIYTICNSPEVRDEEDIFREIDEIKVGFERDGSIKKPEKSVATFSKEWDEGSEDNYMFYTTPASYSALDNINYLMNHFLASSPINQYNSTDYTLDNLPGLLLNHRYKKEWSLIGINKLFEKASANNSPGEYCIETLITQTQEASYKGLDIDITYNIGQSTSGSDALNIHIPNTSVIYNYNVVPMSNSDDMQITNRPVVNYNTQYGTWGIFTKDNSIEAVYNLAKSTITSNLYNGARHLPLMSSNKYKLLGTNTSIQHTVAQTVAARLAARNDMLMRYIFLNQAVSFSARGLTLRTPGKFINILTDVKTLNDFEQKFTGQWLLTEVNHVIDKVDGYTTRCVAVKVSSFDKIKTTDKLKAREAFI